MPDYQPPGAQCARHPDRPAGAICDRCGNFMCDECGQGRTASTCSSCRELTGQDHFPFSRENWNLGGLWDYCWAVFKREWVMLSLCIMLFGAVSGVASALSQGLQGAFDKAGWVAMVVVVVATTLVSSLVQGVAQMGVSRVLMDVLGGRRADLARLTSQLPKLRKFAIQVLLTALVFGLPMVLYFGLLVGLVLGLTGVGTEVEEIRHHPLALVIIGAGTLLGMVPLVYFVLPLTFAARELVLDDEVGPWEAVKRAFDIARGQRLSIIGIALLETLITVLGVLACCVGVVPAAALGQLLMTGLYLALRNGSGLPPPGQAPRAPGARNT